MVVSAGKRSAAPEGTHSSPVAQRRSSEGRAPGSQSGGGGQGLFAAAGPALRLGSPPAPQQAPGDVVQRITYKDAVTQLDPLELPLFKQWIAARSPGAGPGPKDSEALGVGLLLLPIGSVAELRAKLGLFDRHKTREATHDVSYENSVATQLHQHLSRSAILAAHATHLPTLKGVKSALQFHDEAGFAAAHYQQSLAKNPRYDPSDPSFVGGSANWEFKINEARKIDQVLAFEEGGTINLRQGDADMHIAIHELMHKLSAPGIDAALGPVLNEALTEMIARDVCAEQGVALTGEYYSANRRAAQTLLNYYQLNAQNDYCDVYFQNPDRLANLLQRDLGAQGLAVFVRNKDAGSAVAVFQAERDNESQRQVAAGVLIETTRGMYRRIPGPNGRSGKTLQAHVQAALDAYDRATKFKRSAETTAAIQVLRNVLGNHAQLYAAVCWYLNDVTIQPPTVAVGARLNNGSRFHTLLSAEFNQF